MENLTRLYLVLVLALPGSAGQPSRPKMPLRPGDSRGAARRSWGRRHRPEGRRSWKERGEDVEEDEEDEDEECEEEDDDNDEDWWGVARRTLKIWWLLSREHGSSVRKLLYSERNAKILMVGNFLTDSQKKRDIYHV